MQGLLKLGVFKHPRLGGRRGGFWGFRASILDGLGAPKQVLERLVPILALVFGWLLGHTIARTC